MEQTKTGTTKQPTDAQAVVTLGHGKNAGRRTKAGTKGRTRQRAHQSKDDVQKRGAVMNPYEVLGVEFHASNEAIRAAYRALRSEHHPDREGGDAERMVEINVAYELLIDPVARKRYDETGEVGKDQNENDARDRFMMMIGHWLEHESARWPDFINYARRSVVDNTTQITSAVRKQELEAKRMERILKRFKYKGKGLSPVHAIAQQKIDHLKNAAKAGEKDLVRLQIINRLIDEYELEPDGPTSTIETRILAGQSSKPWLSDL